MTCSSRVTRESGVFPSGNAEQQQEIGPRGGRVRAVLASRSRGARRAQGPCACQRKSDWRSRARSPTRSLRRSTGARSPTGSEPAEPAMPIEMALRCRRRENVKRPKGTTCGRSRCRVTHPAAPARGAVVLMRYFVSLRIGERPRRDAHRRYVAAVLGKNTSPKAAHIEDPPPRAQDRFHYAAWRLRNSPRPSARGVQVPGPRADGAAGTLRSRRGPRVAARPGRGACGRRTPRARCRGSRAACARRSTPVSAGPCRPR